MRISEALCESYPPLLLEFAFGLLYFPGADLEVMEQEGRRVGRSQSSHTIRRITSRHSPGVCQET